jgi:hypothetical protein
VKKGIYMISADSIADVEQNVKKGGSHKAKPYLVLFDAFLGEKVQRDRSIEATFLPR